MGLYFIYVENIENRVNNHVFFFWKGKCFIRENEKDKKFLFNVRNVTTNTYKKIVNYASKQKYDAFEILLPNSKPIHELLDYLYEYLLDEDVSIGLLSTDSFFVDNNEKLIRNYGGTIPKSLRLDEIILADFFACNKACVAEQSFIKEKRKTLTTGRIRLHPSRAKVKKMSLETAPIKLDESFHDKLIRLLIESKKDNPDIYKKAGIAKQVFSKMISDPKMIPTKLTLIALCIGLELNIDTANELMVSAGYSLSRSFILDSIIIKYLENEIYDLDVINEELYEYGCPLLGWKPRDN